MDRAIEITGRHAGFFAAVTFCALLLQAVVCFFIRGPVGVDIAAYGLTPVVTTVANIRCALDLRGGDLPRSQLLSWALERLWAVILIDWFFSFAFNNGVLPLFFPGNDPANALVGGLTVALTSTMVFADVYASVEPQRLWLLTVPLAFMRSISLSWRDGNIVRVLALGVFNVAAFLLAFMVAQWFALHPVRGGEFFGYVPLSTLLAAPFAVLFTVVYFDCLAREKAVTS